MTQNTGVDFGRTAADYSRHRAGFPGEFFDRVRQYGVGVPDQRVLDLGTGTGTVARQFAQRGCSVVALDISEALIAEARALDRKSGVAIDYRVARAEDTGLGDASFDIVTASQCWHWFDRVVVAAEAMRLLKPAGSIVIAHFDWLPQPGNVVEATEALIEAFNPKWNLGGGNGLYPAWFADLTGAGFLALESFSFDIDVPYAREAWLGRIRASAGVAASLPPSDVEKFSRALDKLLQSKFPGDPLVIPHRVFAVIGRKPMEDETR